MSHASADAFPNLRKFLGGWFHQDFDLEGDASLAGIVASYRQTSSPEERAAVSAEIDGFLALPSETLDDEFIRTFTPDIDPAGWGMTARQWLGRVRDLLREGV
jgi:hypothetical protein